MKVPKILNMIGKKPWGIPYEDTIEMWSGSQYKHKISLCAGDVVADARVYAKIKGLPDIKDSQLTFLKLDVPK